MCSATRATLRSRSRALVSARSRTYEPCRRILGSIPRTRCRRPWYSSFTTSAAVSSSARTKTNGLAKNRT